MKKHIVALLFLLNFLSFNLMANECGEFLDNFTSPICTDAKYIFWTGTVITLGLRFAKPGFIDEVQDRARQKQHLKSWGKLGSQIGDGYLNGLYILGHMIFGGKDGNKYAEHMFEASFWSQATTQALKMSVHETRPGYPDDHTSFPSGHAAFSFAFASVVTANHGWYWGSLAHLLAGFISFSRINDDWHYLHDVTAGLTIGMSYGWGIYLNHKQHAKPYWFALLPTENLDGAALAYSYQF